MDTSRRFSARQVTVMVVAVSSAVMVAAPVAALAAVGTFTSAAASTPAVSAKNTSSGSGAKAVYGDASASHGTTYGVYGHAASSGGFGVYSAGRLGSSGDLVCSHCVTGGDVDAATLPTVPNASKFSGHTSSYYARVVPFSARVPGDQANHKLAEVDGLSIIGSCSSFPTASLIVEADTAAAANAEVNYFSVNAFGDAQAGGQPMTQSVELHIAISSAQKQTEGTATYRNNVTGRVITIEYHLYGDAPDCEVFGNAFTAG